MCRVGQEAIVEEPELQVTTHPDSEAVSVEGESAQDSQGQIGGSEHPPQPIHYGRGAELVGY